MLRVHLRLWIGHGKDDRAGSKCPEHIVGKGTANGKSYKNVSIPAYFFETSCSRDLVSRELLLEFIHTVLPILVDDASRVTYEKVLFLSSITFYQLKACNASSTSSIADYLDIFDVFLGDLEGINEASEAYNSSAVLVVVENRDLHLLLQLFLDVEAVRGLDVFQVDTTEGRRQMFQDEDKFFRVRLLDTQINAVDARKLSEKRCLSFHDWFACKWTDIAEAEHGCSICDAGDHVSLICVGVR